MADYKDYIVRYNIQANAGLAASQLEQMASAAETLTRNIAPAARSMHALSEAAKLFKQGFEAALSPKINLERFNEDLNAMVIGAERAAGDIRAIFMGALSSNKAINNSTNNRKIVNYVAKDAKEIQKQIAKSQDEIGKSTQQNSKDPSRNLTPTQIKAWKTFFKARDGIKSAISEVKTTLGSLHDLTQFTITPIVDPTAFDAAKKKLDQLVTPRNSITSPVVTEKGKKSPGGNAANPDKQKLTDARKQLKTLQNSAAPIQQRLKKNTAIPEGERSRGIKSQITKDTRALAPITTQIDEQKNIVRELAGKSKAAVPKRAIPVSVKIRSSQVKEALKALEAKLPPLNVRVNMTAGDAKAGSKAKAAPVTLDVTPRINTDSIATQLAQLPAQRVNITAKWAPNTLKKVKQLNTVSSKMPPIDLNLNIEPALAKLSEFKTAVANSSPQNVSLTASGATSASKATANTTPGSVTPSGFAGTGKNMVYWGDEKPSIPAAPGHQWVKATDLQTQLSQKHIPGYQQAAEQDAIKSNLAKLQWQQQEATKTAGRAIASAERCIANIAPQLSHAESVWQKKIAQFKAHPTEANHMQLIEAAKIRGRFKRDMILQERALRYWQGEGAYESAFRSEMLKEQIPQEQGRLVSGVPSSSQYTHGWRQVPIQQGYELGGGNMQFRQQRLADAVSTFKAGLTPYERASKAEQIRISKPEVWRRYNQMATRFRNQLVSLGLTESQMKIVRENTRYFEQATRATGIRPTATTSAASMVQYMNNVMAQMRAQNAAIPVQMQSYTTQMEKLAAKQAARAAKTATTKASVATPRAAAAQGGFAERLRKWAYPLTGNTSFGAQTPMAVSMAKGMGVMYAIGGAMSAVSNSFSQAVEYQNTMKTVQAILANSSDSYSIDGLKNMEQTVREVGVKTKFSAPEVASAAKFLAMANYDADGIRAVIRPIADLALLGDMDLGEVADKMTNIMSIFGANPEDVKRDPNIMRRMGNIMASTATRSNTDLMMLAESAEYGGAVARLYGKNDPNLFADTMAMFGVMGNAGIQASSAGTALRMMYQNIFAPNKKQKQILDQLEKTYSVRTKDTSGNRRSMADVLTDIANNVPENKMADVVGKLFRITAQPGAGAIIDAANSGDDNAKALINGNEEIVKKMSSKTGLSALVSLMQANRAAANGDMLGSIAEEKQNTISGLGAQVTSMFTEAVTQAFEQREGGLAEMLRKVRDYFANPETISMIQNLIDMIISIGKVLAWFVKLWANLYNLAPDLIRWGIVLQMAFTQMGSLLLPMLQLINGFDKLGNVITKLTGLSFVASTNIARGATGAAAGSAAASGIVRAPFLVDRGLFGTQKIHDPRITQRAHNAMSAAGAVSITGFSRGANEGATKKTLDKFKKRANRTHMWRQLNSGYKAGSLSSLKALLAPTFAGLKTAVFGLMSGLAKAIGLLFSPVSLAVIALGGLAWGITRFVKQVSGNTVAQKAAYAKATKSMATTKQHVAANTQWYSDEIKRNIPAPPVLPVIQPEENEAVKEYKKQQNEFQQRYTGLFNDFSVDASDQTNNEVMKQWNNAIASSPLYRIALKDANHYDMGRYHKRLPVNYTMNALAGTVLHSGGITPLNADLIAPLWNQWHKAEDDAINYRNGMVQDVLAMEGANDRYTQIAVEHVADLRKKYLAGTISKKEYDMETQGVRNMLKMNLPGTLSAVGMTAEDLQKTSHRHLYDTYQTGALNVLDANINGDIGSITGKLDAYEWFSDAQNKAKVYSQEWTKHIAHVIDDYHVLFRAISPDGKAFANIELALNMLPDGKIDYDNIIAQIQSKITNWQSTLQDFFNIVGTVYKSMAKAGLIDLSDEKKLADMIYISANGAKHSEGTYKKYYQDYIATNLNSEWVKAGISEQQYADFLMGRSGNTIQLGNKTVTLAEEKRWVRSNLARSTARTVIRQAKPQNESDNNNVSSAPDQDGYASHYDKLAAHPTQVVFNIDSVARFDRTAIASSAEERDIMTALESKIVPSVMQLMAMASNQSNLAGNNGISLG